MPMEIKRNDVMFETMRSSTEISHLTDEYAELTNKYIRLLMWCARANELLNVLYVQTDGDQCTECGANLHDGYHKDECKTSKAEYLRKLLDDMLTQYPKEATR